MKKNYKLILILTVLFVGVTLESVYAITPLKMAINTIPLEDNHWTIVQEKNGTTVLFSHYETNGETYLMVKIENTTTETVTLLVNVSKKSEVLIENYETTISSNNSIQLTDFNSIEIKLSL